MRRTALLALLPALLIVTGWQRLENPDGSGELMLAAALAIAVALVPRGRLRILAGVGAAIVVLSVAFGLSPLDARPFHDRDFVGPLLSRFGGGVVDFYEIGLPFDPGEHERMHGTVVLAVFAFTLLAAVAIAARRPVLAAAATFAGAAWPLTLVPESATTLRGALVLAAALILLAADRPGARQGVKQAALVGAAVAVAALVAAGSPSVAKGAFLDWQQWEPYTRDPDPVSVQYVWDADYDGIDFPKTPTTVLKVKAARRAPYWRATTLDVFLNDHWVEAEQTIGPVRGRSRDSLALDPYLPTQAANPDNWLPQEVTIEALQDTHLVAASVPVAYEADAAETYGSGIAYVPRLRRGQDYRAWSYSPAPTPSELAASEAAYAPELFDRFLAVGGFLGLPAFGSPGRDRVVQEWFAFNEEAAEYAPLYRQARRVVGRPQSPYAAAVALEAWFRNDDSFRYDEHPPRRTVAPPLVAFVSGHRRGYCQHYAGAMALMLRYLGIPARVAAGFTTGLFDQDEGEWTVSDTNAHTWVEVWFEGYGWLPFDPTPGRGRLRSSYTASSLFFDANGATAAVAAAGAAALGLDILRTRLGGSAASPDDRLRVNDPAFTGDLGGGTATTPAQERRDLRILGIIFLVAAGILSVLWVGKTALRRARYVGADSRGVAGAVRAELVDYVADQRIPVASSATPAELSATLRETLDVDAEPLAEALGAAGYGPSSGAEGAARTARRELTSVLRSIRGRLSRKERLRGLLSFRSLAASFGRGSFVYRE